MTTTVGVPVAATRRIISACPPGRRISARSRASPSSIPAATTARSDAAASRTASSIASLFCRAPAAAFGVADARPRPRPLADPVEEGDLANTRPAVAAEPRLDRVRADDGDRSTSRRSSGRIPPAVLQQDERTPVRLSSPGPGGRRARFSSPPRPDRRYGSSNRPSSILARRTRRTASSTRAAPTLPPVMAGPNSGVPDLGLEDDVETALPGLAPRLGDRSPPSGGG